MKRRTAELTEKGQKEKSGKERQSEPARESVRSLVREENGTHIRDGVALPVRSSSVRFVSLSRVEAVSSSLQEDSECAEGSSRREGNAALSLVGTGANGVGK